MKKPQEKGFKWGYAIFVLVLIMALGFFLVGFISLFSGSDVESLSGNVALIPIKGVIVGDEDSESFFEGVIASTDAVELIEKADANPNIKAIILNLSDKLPKG